jgi:hypothetical protein
MYRFKKNYFSDGTTYYAGVGFRGPYVVECGNVSGVFLKNIPLDYVEEYEVFVLVKKMRAKNKREQIEPKTGSESSRVSDNLEVFKK